MATNLQCAKDLQRAGFLAESLEFYRLALSEDPLNPDLWLRCAQVALEVHDFRFGASLLSAYVRAQPADPAGHFELAYARFLAGEYDAAAQSYRRTLELRPDDVLALTALGQIGYLRGRPEEGAAYHDAVLAIESTATDARFVTSIIRLLRGDYARGWPEHESRFDMRQFMNPPWRQDPFHPWHGEDAGDRTIVIHSEGGQGDVLMMARFLPLIAERGKVTLSVQPSLVRLLQESYGDIAIISSKHLLDPDALHAGLFTIPAALGTTLETIPNDVPYLRAPAHDRILEDNGSFRVGLVWAGQPKLAHDPDRSCPDFGYFAPLFEVPGVEWWSLQVGPREGDAAGSLLHRDHRFADFADTAQLVEELDLVIAVDTAVAHLAGAMGKPVWIIVPTVPEFRWMLDRTDSPWYPTARIFRRRLSSEWPEVIARIAGELAAVASMPVARR